MGNETFTYGVEFLGGPLDGHVEAMELPLRTFVGVRIANSQPQASLLLTMLKKWRQIKNGSTVISIYELGSDATRYYYRFLASDKISERADTSEHVIDTLVRFLSGSK